MLAQKGNGRTYAKISCTFFQAPFQPFSLSVFPITHREVSVKPFEAYTKKKMSRLEI